MSTLALPSFLTEMAVMSARRARILEACWTRAGLERARQTRPARPPPRLANSDFDVLAEVKFHSPAAGALAARRGSALAAERAVRYAAAGALAVSVLTEPTRFAGRLRHLRAAAEACPVPVLRKDFLTTPLQVLEARVAGAGGVLLIAKLLDDEALAALLDEAEACALFTLVEAFDERDLERAARALEGRRGPHWIGVNARDLQTLALAPERLLALAPRLPSGIPCVAESGIQEADDARAVAAAGYRLALVGSALMRATDPAQKLDELLRAGRAGARERGAPR